MKAYVRAPYNEACLEELKTMFSEVVYEPWTVTGERYYEDEMLEHLRKEKPDVLITELDRVTEKVLNGYDGLKAIGDCRGTPANIDVEACTKHGIPILCTPGRNNQAVAEMVVAGMLAFERKLIPAVEWAKDGKWVAGTTPYFLWMGHELMGKKVGIIGYGRIGRIVARILAAFDCEVSFYDPFVEGDQDGFRNISMEELFRESDIITIHVPVLDSTKGIVTRELLNSMKPTALFVNAARSVMVDCDALYDVLKEKKIAGAVIDVLDNEPPETEKDTRFLELDNVLLMPHICGASFEVTDHQSRILNEGLKAWVDGGDYSRVLFNKELSK
ncbi:MAG: 2-hydroxyacid dehydrogenase [Mogibacterium sp.]|nr:2-hydroxyacid dehydrogenase [Mogibacterium sp.]